MPVRASTVLCSHGPGEPWAIGITWVHGHLPVFSRQLSESFPLAGWLKPLTGLSSPHFLTTQTFLDLSPLRESLVSWCGPSRQGCLPFLSLWPESTLLCASAHGQVWQSLGCWWDPLLHSIVAPGHCHPQPSHSPIYFCWDIKRGLLQEGWVRGSGGGHYDPGYFQMSTWGSSHTAVVLNPDLIFWQCILNFYFITTWMIFHSSPSNKGCNIC